eukprot:CAMPEP_0202712502 /NCGR_PEP_ID=MMETSP1385-20130828/41774_1 /ASSEMBLY_ACC=CAM_ASM_000861 /TAXON_ID=933848 /ORGANISM="Elphidium margaritaceum" /LENGTH=235 /DNA_ID=CAMNT_0049372565 /DNA_START=99 /DNA_END=805 /DNA_ORIENTATION=+
MEASLQSELGNAVQKAGKKFEIVDHKLSMRNLLSFIECSRRNNDTAYYVHTSLISKDVYSTLCAGGGAFTDVNPAECHACLFFKGELSPVCWQSIAAIIKWITREYKCDVCMIKNIPTDGCHECGFRICAECLIKLTLPTDVQDIDYDPIRHKGKAMVKYDCPQCRQVCYNDLNDKYYQVMDRLENFSQDQARMIVKLSKLDPQISTEKAEVPSDTAVPESSALFESIAIKHKYD